MTDHKSSKSQQTQARMIEAARDVFAREGYADAALSEIIQKAGVTTGAVYYHFTDKKGLFQAAAESLEQEILDEVSRRVSGTGDAWDLFETAVLETLDICARPDIMRIVFREAPAVIGLREWREIEVRYAFGLMQATVRDLAEAKLIITDAPDITSQILLGAVIEAAHTVADSAQHAKSLNAAKSTLRTMLRGLKRVPDNRTHKGK
ncbi:TetR/AcrR family transcriptional regulator [Henriciella marina]|uniref:TetR/AcrR family transcriptional regulator n=1 Tax=Henriciella marina TaxID=453851 RepID=UPI0003A33B81|nr:TetR/AcrR family transcriptional regulator [Henriciella marina]